jgi:flagellar biosynthesis protein FlhF
MQIKRFEAKNMTAALRLVKAELGAEAVILSARSIKKRSGILGSLKYAGVEVTAATDSHAYAQDSSGRNRQAGAVGDPIDTGAIGPIKSVGMYSQHAGDGGNLPGFASEKKSTEGMSGKKYLTGLYRQLTSQGVDDDIAADLIEGIKLIPHAAERLANGESEPLLTGLLQHMGLDFQPIRFGRAGPRVVAFIGTAGAGKTTAIAKLAAHFAIVRKKTVALITLDDVRIGALEQIRVYARIIGVPLAVASNRSDLKANLKRFKKMEFIFIDTPGLNPENDSQIRDLQSSFVKLPAVETQLVLSATTKENDLMNVIGRLEGFERRRLLFTRLDETTAIGNLLNVMIRTNIPVSYVAAGHRVPDDIRPASLDRLIQSLLNKKMRSPIQREPVTLSNTAAGDVRSSNQDDKRPSAYFVANRNSDVYHTAGCKWTKRIKPDHIITFESAAAAAHRSYMPCRNCNPDRDTHPGQVNFEGSRHVNVNASVY